MSKRIYGVLLLVLIACVAVRMQYSFCQSDECFYIAMTNRMSVGQSLIRDEWHPTQFYVPILYLFYYPYKLLVPSVEGVIIYFRIVYLIINSLISYWLFSEQYDSWGSISIVAAAINILYVHGNIMGMSYYGLCVQFMIAFLLSVKRSHETDAKDLAWAVFSGVMLSLAVLCCPFLSLFVISYVVTILIINDERKYGIGTALGVMLSALIYLVWLLVHIKLSDIIENIGYILADPQHTQGIIDKLLGAFQASREYISLKLLFLEMAIIFCLILFHVLKKVPGVFLGIILLLLIFVCNIKSVCLAPKGGFLYSILYTTTIGGFPALLLYWWDKKDRYTVMYYVTGLALAFSFLIASNTILVTMAVGCCISCMAVIVALDHIVREIVKGQNSRTFFRILENIIIWSILITLMLTHFIAVYRDAPIKSLNHRITVGPAKGLITTSEHENQYYEILGIIENISKEKKDLYVLHSSKLPWAYLSADWKYASPTPWTTTLDDQRLMDYYEKHPENKPDIVFVYSDFVGSYEATMFNMYGENDAPNTNSMQKGYGEYINKNGKMMVENQFVRVYTY